MKAILNKFSPQNIFSLSYGSFFGGTCTISIGRVDELTDSCAITGGNGYPEEVEFSIADNEMDNIRETLDMIKHWKNEYECPHDILDGFGWEIKFISDGKKIEKSGYMAYPENYNDVMQELILKMPVRHIISYLTGRPDLIPLRALLPASEEKISRILMRR